VGFPQAGKERPHGLLGRLRITGVIDDIIGTAHLFRQRHLGSDAGAGGGLVDTVAGHEASQLGRLIGGHHQDGIHPPLGPGFEEEGRFIDHQGRAGGQLPQPGFGQGGDGRMHDAVEISPRPGIGEDNGGQRRAIKAAVLAQHGRAKALGQTRKKRRSRFYHLARQLIGAENHGSQLMKDAHHAALAGGDAAGDAKYHEEPPLARPEIRSGANGLILAGRPARSESFPVAGSTEKVLLPKRRKLMTEKRERLWLEREGTVLVVVDVQERLAPAMPPEVLARVVKGIRVLLDAAALLELPVITTEQYPAGIGHTIAPLAAGEKGERIEKTSFSCCGEPAFLSALARHNARRVLLVGMESHVCVFQTLLDLLAHRYEVHLVRDAVCSRRKADYQAALHLADTAGAILTTVEIALFQLLRHSRAPEFKAVSTLIKGR